MVKDNRTWVHPNAIRRGELQESGGYLHYFRHWQHFTLKMDHYRFVRWAASHTTNLFSEDPAFEAAADKLAEQGWDVLDDEERKVFSEYQMKKIEAAPLQDGVSLEGWGRLEGGIGREEITAFAVHNDPNWRPRDFDEDYEKTFSKLRVSVLSAQQEHPGHMWVWRRQRDIGEDDMMGDEDALCVEFYMLPDKLKALAREIAAQPIRPTLTLSAEGLLFRDEVEEALSEPWHQREYVVICDHHHRAILNSIRFDLHIGAAEPLLPDEGGEDDGLTPEIDRSVKHTHPNSVVLETVTKGLRGLKHAIWILAAAIVLAALIR